MPPLSLSVRPWDTVASVWLVLPSTSDTVTARVRTLTPDFFLEGECFIAEKEMQ